MPPIKQPPPPPKPADDVPMFRPSDEGASGSAFLPSEGSRRTASEAPTRVEPSPAHQYLYHPNQWMVMDGHVVPSFRLLHYVPGANGVDEHFDRRTNARTIRTSVARGEWEQKGYTPVPFDAVPPSHKVASYLWQPTGRRDVTLHYCQVVYPDSDEGDCDVVKYAEWCNYLVSAKIISPAPVFVLRKLLTREETRLAKAIDKNRVNSAAAEVVEKHRRNVEAINAAIAGRVAESKPVSASAGAFVPES